MAELESGGAAPASEAASGQRSRPGLVSPALVAAGVPHVFTTREQPHCDAAHASDPARDDERARALLLQLGRPHARLIALHQIHGAGVFDADGELPEEPPDADAVVTSRADRVVTVRVADCVPILFARADGSQVAAAHAGWRGIVAGVLPAVLARLRGAPLIAAIGPCISRAHFEVGPEVAAAFCRAELEDAVHASRDSRPHVDLRHAAELQLRRGGVETIDGTRACTWEDESQYFSYRRDVTHGGAAATGRQGAAISARLRQGE